MGMFGQYLVAEGVITLEDLDRAMEHKRKANRSFGEVAVAEGYLDESDIDEISQEQNAYRQHMTFGDAAVFLGKLTPQQVLEIAQQQTKTNLKLGEALKELGLIDDEELREQLDIFEAVRTQW